MRFLASLVKTAAALAGGVLAPLALSALDHPTGGLLAGLGSHPAYAELWGVGTLLMHNLYDHYLGPAPSQ